METGRRRLIEVIYLHSETDLPDALPHNKQSSTTYGLLNGSLIRNGPSNTLIYHSRAISAISFVDTACWIKPRIIPPAEGSHCFDSDGAYSSVCAIGFQKSAVVQG